MATWQSVFLAFFILFFLFPFIYSYSDFYSLLFSFFECFIFLLLLDSTYIIFVNSLIHLFFMFSFPPNMLSFFISVHFLSLSTHFFIHSFNISFSWSFYCFHTSFSSPPFSLFFINLIFIFFSCPFISILFQYVFLVCLSFISFFFYSFLLFIYH